MGECAGLARRVARFIMTHRIDFFLFACYLVLNIALGIWVARRRAADTRGYFLAGEGLPWYAIGGSIIAANISTEHFIGMIGIAYAVGFVVAQWEWGNWFTFSALIWIFLPFYIRGGLYTMPEFLERRYNSTCRYLFAVCSLVLWIVAQMAVVMLAGGKAMHGMFGWNETVTIVGLAVLAGSYTIYGGLVSVAWTDFLQFVVMMLGGLIVTVVGLHKVGGLHELMMAAPEKFKFIYPATDEQFPWFGVWTLAISVGIWYNCTNQFIVQRCLGCAQRVGCADGRRICRVHEDPVAAAGGHPGHRGLSAVPGPGRSGPGVPDARAAVGPDRIEWHCDGGPGQRDVVAHQFGAQLVQHRVHDGPLQAGSRPPQVGAAPGARRSGECVCDPGHRHVAGHLVQPPESRGLPSDPGHRRLGCRADCRGLPVGSAVETDHGVGRDVRAAVRFSVTPRCCSTTWPSTSLVDAVPEFPESHVPRVGRLDAPARPAVPGDETTGPGEDQRHHLVLERREVAGVGTRHGTAACGICSCGGASSSGIMAVLYAYVIWFQFWGPGDAVDPEN